MIKNKKTSVNSRSLRPAWIEIDLAQLRRNYKIICKDKSEKLNILAVVKDQAYGHGAVQIARVALEFGVKYLAVVTLDEALELRLHGLCAPILLFGERPENQLEICVHHNLTCCVNDLITSQLLAKVAERLGKKIPVHVEIDTGMSRYGIHWTEAVRVIEAIASQKGLILEGVMSHFAQSDEADKSFALTQLQRFQQVLHGMSEHSIQVKHRHNMCAIYIMDSISYCLRIHI